MGKFFMLYCTKAMNISKSGARNDENYLIQFTKKSRIKLNRCGILYMMDLLYAKSFGIRSTTRWA